MVNKSSTTTTSASAFFSTILPFLSPVANVRIIQEAVNP